MSIPNLRPVWYSSLRKSPFRVRSGEVALNCPVKRKSDISCSRHLSYGTDSSTGSANPKRLQTQAYAMLVKTEFHTQGPVIDPNTIVLSTEPPKRGPLAETEHMKVPVGASGLGNVTADPQPTSQKTANLI